MKVKYLILGVIFCAAVSAQETTIAEADVPKKVVQTRSKKSAVLKHKDTTWSKNAAGEYVAVRKIGGGEDMPPEQTITARFKEDGTWIETEIVIGPYSENVRKKLIPKNIYTACLKLVKKAGGEDLAGGVTISDKPGNYSVEASCGEKRVTFDKKGKVIKEE